MTAMDATAAAPLDPAIAQRAAEWMARLWSGEASAQERAACEAWRAAHPAHERAWRRLQAMDDRLDSVPRQAARGALRVPVAAARRRTVQALGLAALAGAAGYAVHDSGAWQMAGAGHATRTGEVREIVLPDGTRVVLDTASAIDLRFDPDERRIVLRAGRILVTSGHGPLAAGRPLRVQTAQGTVQAVGTRFSVRQAEGRTDVAVFEGAVDIRPAQAPDAGLRLAPNRQARFTAEQVQPAAEVDDSAAGWTRGLLVAERMRVADLVAAIGRYRAGLTRYDPAVADLQVTGVFSLRDTDRALLNLSLALPVDVVYRTRYWVTVQARGRH